MARKCKCFETKEEGTTDVFFKAPDGHYYKDEETYNSRLKRVEDRKRVIEIIADLLGYFDGAKFPTVVTRKLKELEHYSYDCIFETFVECRDSIEWAFKNKEFKNDCGKCSYMMAIITNNINDVYKKNKREEKRNLSVNKHIDNIELEEVTEISSVKNTTNKSNHDITEFLGDDLWN